ncbi:MAG: CDP-diacylglycerol--glycerol-3-phosphate 3-phosphatidyltransferase [Ignavibacteriae bacterium HGW-Ignavibacteriae-4]|nr:MAG: CDP-diacylglycerol--glycerol-3-phosphate 3-phosphatidyltransferase [Ignavibacteriae bacterium HGW-Ignavibacteriae-4]
MLFNVPNIISYFRILVAPFFLFFFISENDTLVLISIFLFILGAISDWLDGWYARKYNQSSKWGVFIDPLADKILNSTAFLAFVFEGIIPFWMVLIIILRDSFMTFLRLFADSHKLPIKTKKIAKVKTVLQFVLIIYVISIYFISLLLNDVTITKLVTKDYVYYSMLFLTIFTVWTVFDYIKDNKRVIQILFGYVNK